MLKILYRGEIAYCHLLASLIEKLYQFLIHQLQQKTGVRRGGVSPPVPIHCAYVIHHIFSNRANVAGGCLKPVVVRIRSIQR